MPALRLELSLAPDDAPRLIREADLFRDGARGRPTRLAIIWHDTADQTLAAAGLSLAERREGRATLWRLERMRPDGVAPWTPGAPPPLVAEGDELSAIQAVLPERLVASGLMPVAAFNGETRDLRAGQVAVRLLSGVLRAVAGERRVCRIGFEGDPASVRTMTRRLAGTLRIAVPPRTLAAEALATARPMRDARPTAPELSPEISIGDAFARLAGHLTEVILGRAPGAAAGEAPEPVHDMRVAIRRLRSAISLFRRAVGCAELDEASVALKALAKSLGPARDWDVFTSGIVPAVAEAFAGDRAIARLGARAGRRREVVYLALRQSLGGAEFRQLGLTLAVVAAARPWEAGVPPPPTLDGDGAHAAAAAREASAADEPAASPGAARSATAEVAAMPLVQFAARALRKRHARLRAHGAEIAALPPQELHEIRLDAKRLRYAAEFFAALFPGRHTKRFLRRLAALQERLGHLNDGAVAAALLAEIGHDRAYAGGVVLGTITANAAAARTKIERSWVRFRRLDGFWT